MKKNSNFPITAYICLFTALIVMGCSHSSNGPSVVKSWDMVPMKAVYEIPAPAGRNDTGYASLKLFSDNSLQYTINIGNLASGDMLMNSHIHLGDAGSNGAIIIDLKPSFTGGSASGTITNLRGGQVDTLLAMPVYINVHSMNVGSGLMGGQRDKPIKFAADLLLSGNNISPPVSTSATGACILRLTGDNVLYSNVTVNGLETADMLTLAHIHRGAAGTNGDVRVSLCASAGDFGLVKVSTPLPDSVVDMLLNASMYVNVHSMLHASGLIRGQIR